MKTKYITLTILAMYTIIGHCQTDSLRFKNRQDSLEIAANLERYLGHRPNFQITDSIRRLTWVKYSKDSLQFASALNDFLNANSADVLSKAARILDQPKFYDWINLSSETILTKTGDNYKRSNELSELLALTNVSDSVRAFLKKSNNTICLARLGDTLAIRKYISRYVKARSAPDKEFSSDEMRYWAKQLLFLNSSMAHKAVILDMSSGRIIRQCIPFDIMTNDGIIRSCDSTYISFLSPILDALMSKHRNEPIFNRSFIATYVLSPESYSIRNPYIPIYFSWVEAFIKREYGLSIHITVPYIIATTPD